MDLPEFKYHRHPIQSGSVEESSKPCQCCGKARGYIYSGPVYSENELDDSICPWCIADGKAHAEFDATFVDEVALPDDLPEKIIHKLPGAPPAITPGNRTVVFVLQRRDDVSRACGNQGDSRAVPGVRFQVLGNV
jgi:uncharacterized protein CbrC (UPF0167 family)